MMIMRLPNTLHALGVLCALACWSLSPIGWAQIPARTATKPASKPAKAPAARAKTPAARAKAPAVRVKAPVARAKAPAAKAKTPAAKAPAARGKVPVARAKTPASRPVVAARVPAPRPAGTKAAKPVEIQALVNPKGVLSIDGKAVSLGQFGALLLDWKRRTTKPQILLVIAPKAPRLQVLLVTQLLKAEGIPWKRHGDVTPKAKPKVAVGAAGLWQKVPLAYQRNAKGKPGLLEVRGQALDAARKPIPMAFLGLVARYHGKRDTEAVVRSDAQGRFRFQLIARKSSVYRVSLLQGANRVEFPLPWQRARQGVLYLRVSLASLAPTPRVPIARRPAPRRAAPMPRRTIPAPRRAPGQTPKVVMTSSKGRTAKQRCDWSKAPKGAAKVLPAKGRVQLRVQLLSANGQPAGRLPTGIVSVQGKRSKLIARSFSNESGCLIYTIDPNLAGTYQMFVFRNNKVHAHPFKDLKKKVKGKTFLYQPIWLSTKKAQKIPKTEFIALFMFFESVDLDWVKVNFVSTIYYMPTPDKPKPPPFVLPVPKGAVRLGLDKSLRQLRPTMKKDGLHLGRLRAGRNRLWYSFLMPRNTDAEVNVKLSMSHHIKHVRAYFEKGKLMPGNSKKQLKTVSFGNKHKTTFDMLTFAEAQPDQILKFMVAPRKRPMGGLIGWIARMKRHRKKNKLLGLGLLLGITCLGLCWLVIVPRSTPQNTDTSA